MGQGPCTYLLVGDGRLSRHLQAYFQALNLPYALWTRQHASPLRDALCDCTHVLLAIPDDALADFLNEHPELSQYTVVHFSGSLSLPGAWGAHPLMTFTRELYPVADYLSMHFVMDRAAPEFDQLLPGLPNTYHRLDPAQKARYHAECVLSGNFTALLWSHFFRTLESQLGLPREAALPYLRRVAANLESPANPLTGPLVRGDQATVDRNLRSLEGDPYQQVYSSFVEAYAQS